MPIEPSQRSGGVCSPWAELGDMPCQTYEADPNVMAMLCQFSSDVLYDLTGRQWPGLCLSTVRPQSGEAALGAVSWPGNGYRQPWLVERGVWGCSCNRSERSGCSFVPEIKLADRVVSVSQVKIDGVVVPTNEYRIDDHRYLVGLRRPDGSERTWPCCQDDGLPDTQPHTFSVSFTRGGYPPVGGTVAAASLACEFAKGMGLLGDDAAKKCRLPRRVTSIVRQNVSVAVLDPLTLFQDGRTGLPEVDLWLASVVAGRARRRATMIPMGKRRRSRRPGS
jgi:hypothetical protein